MTEKEIIKQLEAVLDQEPDNYNKILELSSRLSSFDKQNVRFSVDAGVINRLGIELVGRHETAVSELVKNSYDADALTVDLFFGNCDKPGGKVEIVDNGVGMTREQLINGFMTISSSDKIHNPKSPRYNRVRAGQKGIGRFATQRLGEKLTVITQTIDSEKALKITVNWEDYAIDSNLMLITNKIEEVEKQKKEGTTLIIEKLRDGWSEAMLKRSFRYITDLLQPFPLSERLEISENDPGFKAAFYKDGDVIIDEESGFFQHSLAEIEAYVDEEGQGYYSFHSKKLGVKEEVYLIGKDERDNKYLELRNIHLKAYYFIYNGGGSNFLPKTVNSYILENAKENGGVRFYRNGFRVLPYAEKDDDWLGLDASMRRRSILAPHSNLHFFGFVEVIDKRGDYFQELSSREGLIETNALKELKDFGYKVLTDVAIKISYERDRKGTAGQKNWNKKSSEELIKEVQKEVGEILTKEKQVFEKIDVDERGNIEVKLKTVTEKLTELEATREEESKFEEEKKKELLKEIQLLRILAGLGLTIGEFVHEIGHYEPAFKYDAELLTQLIKDKQGKEVGERLKNNLNAFTVYTSFFKDAISENVNRELQPIELREPVSKFLEIILPDMERNNFELEPSNFIGYNLLTCPMHFSEWASILFNFYSNSKKAIKKTSSKGKIHIEAGKLKDKVYLEFSDNGIGVPSDKEDEIFEAFYTTSSPTSNSATEIEELTGTGLGLKIVKDIIEGYGGEVFITTPKKNYVTTIRIELPKTDISDYEQA